MTSTTVLPTGYQPKIIINQPTPWFNLAMILSMVPSLIVLIVPSAHQTATSAIQSVTALVVEAQATQECINNKAWWNVLGQGKCLSSSSVNLKTLGYGSHQQSVINRIVAVGTEMGMSDEDITIAIATCLVETQCKELTESESDRDSRGPFQQRPSQGWTDSKDTTIQAKAFFEKLRDAVGDTPGARAQDVQRSAYPERYDKRMSEAETIMQAIRNGGNSEVVAIAEGWVGKHFKEGQSAQCAYFVRDVFTAAGYDLGVTSNPMDGVTEPMTLGMANSMSGTDIGKRIRNKDKLKPGDILFFSGTYRPEWVLPGDEEDMITHVGIYVGNGMMVDRPTASRPVQKRSIDTFTFYGAIRPKL